MNYPRTYADWARELSILLDGALMAADPENQDRELDQHRETLDRFVFWRAEQNGQLSMPISQPVAAHGCHEEETE